MNEYFCAWGLCDGLAIIVVGSWETIQDSWYAFRINFWFCVKTRLHFSEGDCVLLVISKQSYLCFPLIILQVCKYIVHVLKILLTI